MNKKTILIADDHPAMRAGIKQMILSNTDFTTPLEAETGDKALSIIKEREPDIAMLDIQMPGLTGLQVAEKLSNENLKTNVILLTMFDDKKMFLKAMEVGVRGYLLKDSTEKDITDAVKKVFEGGLYLSPELSGFLLKPKTESKGQNVFKELTATEIKIITLISELKSNAEIADELFISKRTVENYKVNIARKLKLNTRTLLKYAIEHKDML